MEYIFCGRALRALKDSTHQLIVHLNPEVLSQDCRFYKSVVSSKFAGLKFKKLDLLLMFKRCTFLNIFKILFFYELFSFNFMVNLLYLKCLISKCLQLIFF